MDNKPAAERIRTTGPVIPVKPVLAENDRVSVTIQVTHEQHGEQPKGVAPRFSRRLPKGVEAYVRRLKAQTEWHPLDMGWVPNPGYVLIENRTGAVPTVIPTEEEKAELARQVIELSFDGQTPVLEIPPGEFHFFRLCSGQRVFIRAAVADVPFQIFITPR